MVNHVYRSLPQTPLISGASPSVLHHHHHHLGQQQQELLLGDHRRRSYGGEKGQLQADLAHDAHVTETAAGSLSSRPAADDMDDMDGGGEEPLIRHVNDDSGGGGDHLNDNGNSASGSRFKFRPLVTSKSSENFQQLRRVAMAAVNNPI